MTAVRLDECPGDGESEVVARVPVGAEPNGVSFASVALNEQPDTKIDLPSVHGSEEDTEEHIDENLDENMDMEGH